MKNTGFKGHRIENTRIASFVLGILVLFSTHIKTWDTNFFDVLCVLIYMTLPASLIIAPMVLEFLERKEKWKQSKKLENESDKF